MPNEAIRMTAHAIGAAVDFNEIGADDEFVDAPAHDHLQRGFNAAVETVQMRDARIRDLEAAVETGRTALTVSQDRVRELEAALRQSLNPELEPMLWEDYVASVLGTVETKPICSCSTGMPLRRDCQVDHFASETGTKS